MVHNVQQLTKVIMLIPCLLITIHLVKNLFKTLDGNNKITNKNITSLNKLEKILKTSQYSEDASNTQKNFNVTK
jgi:choline-glycine betaine transporter